MRTLLYGAYGTGNLGDDLLLKGALIESKNEEVEVVAYGAPALIEPVKCIDHFDFICKPEKYLSPGDKLIFGGGGLFWAPTHCDDMLKVSRAAAGLGCDVQVRRIGAQGFHCNPSAVTEIMSIASDVSVRDINSVKILKEYGITSKAYYLPDYVLTLSDYVRDKYFNGEKAHGSKLRIGLNHSATPFYHDVAHRKKALMIYAEVANKFSDQVDFIYIPHTRHFNCIDQNDVIYGEYFWNASAGRIKNSAFPSSIDELLSIYSTLDGAIGWRYHLLILASLFGIESAFMGELGGHKYGAYAQENDIPQIDFRLETDVIVSSISRWINRIIESKSAR